ncbi:flavodoxin family protein [Clostridium sp. KNHs205]|uniref:flavodoxin family protein n=1 Tax=Clostridium sp. KNHs205 TaxID=1449050 RepID=UPI00068937E9|nr:flavodoxin family protein [Clostridium sp. KNHs205]
MKTLIINGSTKKNGDTSTLIDEFQKFLKGEVKTISCSGNISPCRDCRYCWTNSGCCIEDEMQEIYPFLDECENVVLASPIWFSSLSGPLLNIASRFQTLFAAAYFRKEQKAVKQKNGVILLVGAEKGTEVIPTQNALTIMKFMNVKRPCIATVYSLDTNNTPVEKDRTAIKKAHEAALLLNRLCDNNLDCESFSFTDDSKEIT